MLIIGCDYQPGFQQIAGVEIENGEYVEKQLEHDQGEAERFYRDLKLRGVPVRVGMEATINVIDGRCSRLRSAAMAIGHATRNPHRTNNDTFSAGESARPARRRVLAVVRSGRTRPWRDP